MCARGGLQGVWYPSLRSLLIFWSNFHRQFGPSCASSTNLALMIEFGYFQLALILAGMCRDGTPTAPLERRVEAAVKLYQQVTHLHVLACTNSGDCQPQIELSWFACITPIIAQS